MFDYVCVLVDDFVVFGILYFYMLFIIMVQLGFIYGYDVVDFIYVNFELGGECVLEQLVDVLYVCGMGFIVDIVLNYMGVGGVYNVWWLDVFEFGLDSVYVNFFDIDWQLFNFVLCNKVFVFFLGENYVDVLVGG